MPSLTFSVTGLNMKDLSAVIDEMQETGISTFLVSQPFKDCIVTFDLKEWKNSLKAVGNEDLKPNEYADYLETELRDFTENQSIIVEMLR